MDAEAPSGGARDHEIADLQAALRSARNDAKAAQTELASVLRPVKALIAERRSLAAELEAFRREAASWHHRAQTSWRIRALGNFVVSRVGSFVWRSIELVLGAVRFQWADRWRQLGERAKARRLIEESGLFDPDWYRAAYPDAASTADPLSHYMRRGRVQGYSPGPRFDPAWYLANHPDVAAANYDPLLHYIRYGMAEGRAGRNPATPRMMALSTGASKKKHSFPDLTSVRAAPQRGRIAVVLHLFYPDLWSEFAASLASIAEPFDLIVSLTTAHSEEVYETILRDYPHAHIFFVEDHGRDLLPFVALIGSGVLFRYDLVCKLHSKRSPHLEDGNVWRRQLVDGIMRDQALVKRIVAAFDANRDLGLVVADGNLYGDKPDHWIDNQPRIIELGKRIGIDQISPNARFPGGSIYWIRPFLLRMIAALDLKADDFDPEPMYIDGTTGHAIERLVGLICEDAGMQMAGSGKLPALAKHAAPPSKGAKPKVHLIAYYLPQFHPTPENDLWWGEGFTEWMNVTRAKPMFHNHRQPRRPTELGFYDLRMPEARQAQAALAERYGLSAFCYYYYWFDKRRVLHRPLDEVLRTGEPKFPFLLCWANEPWSRNWDGGNRELLIPQEYGPGWVEAFARDVAPIIRDPRYFRLNGKPVLLIYRIMHVPNRTEALSTLRAELKALGVGRVHIGAGWVGFIGDDEHPADPGAIGLDSYFEFPPHRIPAPGIADKLEGVDPLYCGEVYSYDGCLTAALSMPRSLPPGSLHRAAMLGWDNTARTGHRGNVYHGATPAKFHRWLRQLMKDEETAVGPPERMILINAWNEWAEGSYLEPDDNFGRGWLEAVALSRSAEPVDQSGAKHENKKKVIRRDLRRRRK